MPLDVLVLWVVVVLESAIGTSSISTNGSTSTARNTTRTTNTSITTRSSYGTTNTTTTFNFTITTFTTTNSSTTTNTTIQGLRTITTTNFSASTMSTTNNTSPPTTTNTSTTTSTTSTSTSTTSTSTTSTITTTTMPLSRMNKMSGSMEFLFRLYTHAGEFIKSQIALSAAERALAASLPNISYHQVKFSAVHIVFLSRIVYSGINYTHAVEIFFDIRMEYLASEEWMHQLFELAKNVDPVLLTKHLHNQLRAVGFPVRSVIVKRYGANNLIAIPEEILEDPVGITKDMANGWLLKTVTYSSIGLAILLALLCCYGICRAARGQYGSDDSKNSSASRRSTAFEADAIANPDDPDEKDIPKVELPQLPPPPTRAQARRRESFMQPFPQLNPINFPAIVNRSTQVRPSPPAPPPLAMPVITAMQSISFQSAQRMFPTFMEAVDFQAWTDDGQHAPPIPPQLPLLRASIVGDLNVPASLSSLIASKNADEAGPDVADGAVTPESRKSLRSQRSCASRRSRRSSFASSNSSKEPGRETDDDDDDEDHDDMPLRFHTMQAGSTETPRTEHSTESQTSETRAPDFAEIRNHSSQENAVLVSTSSVEGALDFAESSSQEKCRALPAPNLKVTPELSKSSSQEIAVPPSTSIDESTPDFAKTSSQENVMPLPCPNVEEGTSPLRSSASNLEGATDVVESSSQENTVQVSNVEGTSSLRSSVSNVEGIPEFAESSSQEIAVPALNDEGTYEDDFEENDDDYNGPPIEEHLNESHSDEISSPQASQSDWDGIQQETYTSNAMSSSQRHRVSDSELQDIVIHRRRSSNISVVQD